MRRPRHCASSGRGAAGHRRVCGARRRRVTGFDGILAGELHAPALTTVRQPREAIGRLAVRILAGALAGEADARPPASSYRERPLRLRPTSVRRRSYGPLTTCSTSAHRRNDAGDTPSRSAEIEHADTGRPHEDERAGRPVGRARLVGDVAVVSAGELLGDEQTRAGALCAVAGAVRDGQVPLCRMIAVSHGGSTAGPRCRPGTPPARPAGRGRGADGRPARTDRRDRRPWRSHL